MKDIQTIRFAILKILNRAYPIGLPETAVEDELYLKIGCGKDALQTERDFLLKNGLVAAERDALDSSKLRLNITEAGIRTLEKI